MDADSVASIVVAVGGVAAGLIGWFKRKPGQKESDAVDVAEASLSIAKGTISLITEGLQEELKRITVEQRELRAQHQKELAVERQKAMEFRNELDAATEDVRKLRIALKRAGDELEACRKRCLELERQLAISD